MARFVLVHGGFSGAWIWLPLIDTLREAGHVVEAFDLPGMGDDHTSASEVSLDSYAGRVCEVLAANSEPAIVVGHSMGGIVATQAAARSPKRVAALVYVAAFLPKDGQSLLDLTKLPEGCGEQVLANVVVKGEVAVMPAAASRHALYGACTEDVAAWAIEQQCPQPVSPLPVAVSIPPGALNGIDRYYVLCTRDRAIPPSLQRRMVAENPCAGVIELDADHTPQLSMTNELAKALHQFATHSSAGAGRLADRKDRAHFRRRQL